MVDQLPTVQGDAGAREATPVTLFDTEGNALGAAASPLIIAPSGITASASFTPAAAAYGALDIIGTSQEFAFSFADGTAVPAGSLIRILTAIMKINVSTVQSGEGAYVLEGFSETQPSAQADNDLFTLGSNADLTAYRGPIPLGTPVDRGAVLYVKSPNIDLDIKLVTSSLWGRLVTTPTFTATAVARQVFLYGVAL